MSDYDVLVVGSGFGGSVSALRLTEKGYKVGVVEAGRRFEDKDFAKTSWRLREFLFAPKLGLQGIQRIHFLRDVIVLAGAGVGGGSLVYANTLYVPPDEFFNDKQWAHITDWKSELAPYYEQATRMLGVTKNPTMTPADVAMKAVAEEMGVGETFTLTPVGVFFGAPAGETVPDPFFGGVGPDRTGCIECGECMTGCRHNAKNTLVKNYLGLAEKAGAEVMPLTTVRGIRKQGKQWQVDVERSGNWLGKGRRTITADHVIMAAGTFNTQKILHRMKDTGHLPKLAPSLGYLSRTNSESLIGAVAKVPPSKGGEDFTKGVAITSSFFPEPHTHIEPVRYGKGSNSMGLLGTILTDEEPGVPRWKTWARELAADPIAAAKSMNVHGWSQRAVIALVMQTLDNSVTVSGGKGLLGRWKLTSRASGGDPVPTWIPSANKAVRLLANKINGTPMGNMGDVANASMTAHFVGGCAIGDNPEAGVVDPYHRAYGYNGLHIVDGSAITANLGVNPSLTITAQAERAMAMWPNKGEVDPRPAMGQQYQRVIPVAPYHPVVPTAAPGALRLPIIEVRQSVPDGSGVR